MQVLPLTSLVLPLMQLGSALDPACFCPQGSQQDNTRQRYFWLPSIIAGPTSACLEARCVSFPVQLLTVVMLLQATLLPLCTTLCALNQDGTYATVPWLTRQEAGKLYEQTALSKAAALDALSLQQDTPQHAEQQPMQVKQPYVPQHDKQHVQQTADPATHELSSVSNATSGSFFQDVPDDASDISDKTEEGKNRESREEKEDNSWWWNELIMEKPGSALPVKVQGLSGQKWYAVVIRVAVGLVHGEDPHIRSAVTLWLNKAVST